MKQTIRDRVRFIRTVKQISLTELARKVGLSKGALSQFENGIIGLTAENIKLIASALEVSGDYLLFGEDRLKLPNVFKDFFINLKNDPNFQKFVELMNDKNLTLELQRIADLLNAENSRNID